MNKLNIISEYFSTGKCVCKDDVKLIKHPKGRGFDIVFYPLNYRMKKNS